MVEYQPGMPETSQHVRRKESNLRDRLLLLYGLLTTVTLVGLYLFTAQVRDRLKQDVMAADTLLARSLALQLASGRGASADFSPEDLRSQIQSWPVQSDPGQAHLISVLAADGTPITELSVGLPIPADAAWQRWRREVASTARFSVNDGFLTTAPDETEWLHVRASAPTGNLMVLLQRPTSTAFAAAILLNRAVLITSATLLFVGLLFWLYLSRRVIQPLTDLEAFSGLIRWRGDTQDNEKKRPQEISRRSDEIGGLARSLIALESDIETRFLQLSTLLETSRMVASSLDVGDVMTNILIQVEQLFGVARCAVVVLDRRADVLRIRASRGLSETYVQKLRIDPSLPDSITMRALRNRAPIQIADTERDLSFASFRPRARTEGFRSVLAIPLLTQHAPPAALVLYKADPYSYSYQELELASSFGHHASIALENAALYARSDEQLQEQTRRLEAIVESLDDGLILEGTAGELLFCNQQAAELAGLPRREARRSTSATLLDRLLSCATDPAAAEAAIRAAVEKSGSREFDLAQTLPGGRRRDVRLHLFDVLDASGELIGHGQLWQDVSQDKELDRMKSSLISVVSHELRTPLAAIKGYTSTLLAEDVTWDESSQRDFLRTISQETDRLTALVQNLLDMSRIEAGLLQMHFEPYPLNDVLRQTLDSVQFLERDRLRLHLEPGLPLVPMDVSRISTVVRNLLENAVKYSPPDRPIELTTGQVNGEIQCRVRDHGSGVPAGSHSKIFERFYREDNRLTREVGGTGLGLAICKGFVEAHGGRIWVEPANPGAVFSVALPVASPE